MGRYAASGSKQAEHPSPTARLNREGWDPSVSQTIRCILVQKSSPSSAPKPLACPLTLSLQREPAAPSCSFLSELITWKSQPRMHKLKIALTLPKETSNLLLCTAQTKSCCLEKHKPTSVTVPFASFHIHVPSLSRVDFNTHGRDPMHTWLLGGY